MRLRIHSSLRPCYVLLVVSHVLRALLTFVPSSIKTSRHVGSLDKYCSSITQPRSVACLCSCIAHVTVNLVVVNCLYFLLANSPYCISIVCYRTLVFCSTNLLSLSHQRRIAVRATGAVERKVAVEFFCARLS